MTRQITLLRYRLSPGLWEQIITDDRTAQRFGQAFRINQLFGQDGNRYGFVNCTFIAGTVVGYFAHEGTKEIINYDPSNQQIISNSTSFAHIVFALHVPNGQVGLQDTRITDFVDLNMGQMRSTFPQAIAQMLNNMNLPLRRITLETERIQFTPGQLYEIFVRFKTTELRVTNLSGRKTPTYEEFKLFNPRVDEDKIFRQIFEEDLENGLDTIEFQAPVPSDIRSSATARLAARTGDVVEVKIPRDDGRVQTFTTAVSDKFRVEVSSESEKQAITAQDVERIQQEISIQANYVFIVNNSKTLSDITDLPLFSHLKDNKNNETLE